MSVQFAAIPSGTVATANFTSTTYDASLVAFQLGNIGFHVIPTGLSSADATVKLQHSNTDVAANFVDVDNSTLTLSGSTVQAQIMTNQSMRYYRVVFTKNTNAAGTIQVDLNFQ